MSNKKIFTTATLGCYFIFLLYLLRTNNLKLYINPRLSFLTVVTVAILGAMLLHNLLDIVGGKKEKPEAHGDCCNHQGKSSSITKSNYLILLPIVLSMVVAPQTLSYQISESVEPTDPVKMAAGIQPLNDASNQDTNANYYGKTGSGALTEKYREYTQLDIGNILFDTLKPPKDELVNSRVYLIGRVLKAPQLATDEVILYRIVISCCAADGLPVGVLVKLPKQMKLRENDWVGVEGRIQLLPFEERLRKIEPVANMVTPEKIFAHFSAESVTKIARPDEEYLYP